MFTLQNIVIGLCVVLFVWYFAGSYMNRSRSAVLIKSIKEAAAGAGKSLSIKWYGRSAFQIDVNEPQPPLRELRLLCLLEPRDFALALLWTRLRGRRDQVQISATYAAPPQAVLSHPLTAYGIKSLRSIVHNAEPPHLQLALQVGKGDEATIAQAMELLKQFSLKKHA